MKVCSALVRAEAAVDGSAVVVEGRAVAAARGSAPAAVELAVALARDAEAVDACLAGLQPGRLGGIGSAAREHLLSGGKRVRPLLTCAVLRACGGEPAPHLCAISAVELVHAASLLHDDIIDDAPTRRGRPAAHVVMGTHAAVLAGDYLVARAFEDLGAAGQPVLQARLAQAVTELCEGEALERARRFDPAADLEHARLVNRLKTGALFGYAAEAGATLAGAPPATRAAAREYGLRLGEAFQIADDVLDFEGSPGALGKPVGQDLAQGAITVPMALALALEPALGGAVAACWGEGGGPDAGRLAAIAARVRGVGALAAARDLARAEARRARAALAELPAGPWRERLSRVADEVAERGT
jgi:octaprenyl-diphosphate synthase